MDPITILCGITLANIILEKGILPARRIRNRSKNTKRYHFLVSEVGAAEETIKVETLGLTPDEVVEILNNPTVQRGRDTETAVRRGEQHVGAQ